MNRLGGVSLEIEPVSLVLTVAAAGIKDKCVELVVPCKFPVVEKYAVLNIIGPIDLSVAVHDAFVDQVILIDCSQC